MSGKSTMSAVNQYQIVSSSPQYSSTVKKEELWKFETITELQAPLKMKFTSKIFYFVLMVILCWGWSIREEDLLTAESGLGYVLGIVGGSLMVSLLLYPFRKRVRWMNRLGKVKHWFQFHMFAGTMGPFLILFHANFQLGSVNSRIVLASTLLVAFSGFIGKHIYTKIHYGLYGRKIKLEELQLQMQENCKLLDLVFTNLSTTHNRYIEVEKNALSPEKTLWCCFFRGLLLGFKIHWVQMILLRQLKREIRAISSELNWSAKRQHIVFFSIRKRLAARTSTSLRIMDFAYSEKLFSLWHFLHLPLFVLMVITGLIHVLAVHMY